MKILVFGSCNRDMVLSVKDIVQSGETVSATDLGIFAGGKGLNQALALSRAGAETYFAGAVGEDGTFLKALLAASGVDVSLVKQSSLPTGSAYIQVSEKGENCIIVYPGANADISEEYADFVLSKFEAGDGILLQNEISEVAYIIRKAHEKGMIVFFNPSPINEAISSVDFSSVDWLIVNEHEGEAITGVSAPNEILAAAKEKYPTSKIVLTLGGKGSVCQSGGEICRQKIYTVPTVDTTAAGDTFTGYFISRLLLGEGISECLKYGAAASAAAVMKKGAEPSIPYLETVEEFLRNR